MPEKTRSRRGRSLRWALRAYGFLFALFTLLPIFIFIPLSFNERPLFYFPIEGFSLRWYDALLSSRDWASSLANSIVIGLASTLLATVLGVMAAVGLWRSKFRGRTLVMAILLSPMVVPTVITGASLYLAFTPLGLSSSYLGLVLAHSVLASPFVLVTVGASLAKFDPVLLRAAASLGSPPPNSFRKVTLPLIVPGVVTGSIFAFAVSFDDVVVALFLAGPEERTLPVQMYLASNDFTELTITAAAAVMLAIALGLMTVVEVIGRSDRLKSGDGDRG